MTRPEKLVQVRRQQRAAAARQLEERNGELERLQQARARLLESYREELKQAAEGGELSVRRLERLDMVRRAAQEAEVRTSAAVEEARREVAASGVALRQMEWLRDRLLAAKRDEERKRDQRSTDAAGSRIRRGKSTVPGAGLLLLALASLAGCSSADATAPRKQQDAAATKRQDAAVRSPARRDGGSDLAATERGARKPAKSDDAELKLLTKLRERAAALLRAESALTARKRELSQLEQRTRALLAELKGVHDELKGRLPGATKAQRAQLAGGQKKASGVGAPASRPVAGSASLTRAAAIKGTPLVKVVLRMKPRAAGELLSAMNAQEAARVLLALPRERAARLLARISEESIGAVGDAMAVQQRPVPSPTSLPIVAPRPAKAAAKKGRRRSAKAPMKKRRKPVATAAKSRPTSRPRTAGGQP